jgi:carboxyl-terminal processing protease
MRRSGWLALLLFGAGLATGGWLLRTARPAMVPLTPTRLFEQVMTHVRRFGVDSLAEAELYRRAADGLLWELDDENATLLTAGTTVAEIDRPDAGGFGLLLATRDDQVRVLGVLPGSSADRAGLAPGDIILEIEGRPVEANRRDELRKLLTGPPGSTVSLSFRRPGITPLARAKLVHGDPASAVVLPGIELEPGVGYVAAPLLGAGAAAQLREAIEDLQRQGIRALVLDLRASSSGDVAEAVRVAGLFLPRGTEILRIEGRAQAPERHVTDQDPAFPSLPLVAVVDSGTADVAEVVAGALQEQDRALLVGQPTFGRGQSADVFPLGDRLSIRLSTGRWVTALGRAIQRDSAASDTLERRPAVTTKAGRTVRGGGGVVPDSIVAADTLADSERALYRALGSNLTVFYDSLRVIGRSPAPAAR